MEIIEADAFYDCDALTAITIPAQVTSIGERCFYDCDLLETVTMGDAVTAMGNATFQSCDVLKNVKLSRGLTAIPESAFQECALLEEIVVPYYVTTISNNAFNSSPKLVKVVLPRGLESIGTGAFSYANVTVIYGVPGTYAETWASENGYQFVAHEVAATEISLNKTELTLNKGASETLILSIAPVDSNDTITWKSGNEEIVTVSDKGEIKAVGVGSATVKVMVGSLSASCKITVVQPVTSISLNKSSISMEGLQTYQLTATVNPDNAANKAITWTSSDPAVATVDSNGLVTAVAKGKATITVEAQDGSGVTRSCTVTVTNTGVIAQTPVDMECSGGYPVDCTDFWVYTEPGAKNLEVTFDGQTQLEDGFDYLYIYDGQGNQVGKYTGAELAGKTIIVPGDTVKIQLDTDSATDASSEWGFKVTVIKPTDSAEHVHDYSAVVTAPTCNAEGYTTYTCSCGDSYVGDKVPATGAHIYTDDQDTTCDVCGYERTVEPGEHEHTYESVVTAPTCGERGYTTHTCSGCGDSYVDSYVDATGEHTYTDDQDTTCDACGYERTIEPDEHEHTYEAVVTEPTCILQGYTTYTCSGCGDSYKDSYVDATDIHTYATGGVKSCIVCGYNGSFEFGEHDHTYEAVVTAPTCTKQGYTTYTCACGKAYMSDLVAATGVHNYEAVVTAPTNDKQGYTTHTCSGCGDSYVDSYTDAIGGHEHNYEAVVTAPTCGKQGYTTYTCTCGDVYTSDFVAATGEHSYESAVTDPTCGEQGYTTHTCACGDSYVDTYVDATGKHSYGGYSGHVDTDCNVCGKTDTDHTHNFEFTSSNGNCNDYYYSENLTCTICGSTYREVYMSGIDHTYAYEITKEATETEAGTVTYTCKKCDYTYTEDILPGTRATVVGNCGENVQWTLDMDTGILTISGEGSMQFDRRNFKYGSFAINPWVAHIDQITGIVIEEGITSIVEQAFKSCDQITCVIIPESVTWIGPYAFSDCDSLDTVIFEGDAPSMGSLVFADDTLTVYYPAGNETWTEEVMQNYGGEVTWQTDTQIPTVAMYRLYNPNSGEHFYTGSEAERDNLTAAGWQYEGVAWNAPIKGGDPVYRMYNPNAGDHHYTMSWEEVEMLEGYGWIYEGVCWNSIETIESVPLYRLYNPNAYTGTHHYTGSEEERDYLVSLGWIYEGIGWYGIA